MGGHHASRNDPRVAADSRTGGGTKLPDATGGRHETLERVLRRDPELDRRSAKRDLRLRETERLAGGHPQLEHDQVQPRHQFGYGMLNLEPRVHFQKVEASFRINEELDGPGVPVAGAARQPHGGLSHLGPQLG